MNKKSGPTPPTSDTEHEPEVQPEIPEVGAGPDPERLDAILQDVLDSVKKYRKYKDQKEGPEEEPDS